MIHNFLCKWNNSLQIAVQSITEKRIEILTASGTYSIEENWIHRGIVVYAIL